MRWLRTHCVFILFVVAATPFAARQVASEPQSKFPRYIKGTVTDVDGIPILGARVEYGFMLAAADERQSTLTDGHGRYRLKVTHAGADFRIGVSSDGYAPAFREDFVPGTDTDPAIFSPRLKAGEEIRLQIINRDGDPIPQASIGLATSPGYSIVFDSMPRTPIPGLDDAVASDADGIVHLHSLPVLPPRTTAHAKYTWITLNVSHPAGRRSETHRISPDDVFQSQGEPLVIRVQSRQPHERGALIRGRVVDKSTQQPVDGCLVTGRYSSDAYPALDAGRFSLGGSYLRGRRKETRVFRDGYAVAVARIMADIPSEAEEHVVELDKFPSLHGQLVAPDGKPVANAKLLTGHNRSGVIEWSQFARYNDSNGLSNVLYVTTDESGRFTVPESPMKMASVYIKIPGYVREVIDPEQRPAKDARGQHVFKLRPAAKLTVRANRSSQLGKAATHVWLGVRTLDDLHQRFAALKLNDRGEAAYESLAAGTYTVWLRVKQRSQDYQCLQLAVELTGGEDRRLELGELFGPLTLSGHAEPFTTVVVEPKERTRQKAERKVTGGRPESLAVIADVDGEFSITGLFADEYSVRWYLPKVERLPGVGLSMPGQVRSVRLERDEHVQLGPL